jgi:hypothetical protein
MRAVCLIPSIRPDKLPTAVESAKSDGWDVLVAEDKNREGVCILRNRLLQQALQEGYDLIRYLDDDDILLPHLATVTHLFERGSDVVYTDYRLLHNGVSKFKAMFANPSRAVCQVPPDCCGWIATANALRKVSQQLGGDLWPPYPLTEGYHVFLELFKAGLKIEHSPVQAFEYRMGEGLHNFNDGGLWIARYWMSVEEAKQSHPHLFA